MASSAHAAAAGAHPHGCCCAGTTSTSTTFPGARDATPYAALVAAVCSQQTQMSRVLPLYERWMEAFPTLGDAAAATSATVLRVWGRAGYPRRAVALHEAARVCMRDHSGALPGDHKALLALPSVGPFTASIVRCDGFGAEAVAVDTNVVGVAGRLVIGDLQPARDTPPAVIAAAAERLMRRGTAARWNPTLMEYGARICTPRPRCEQCASRTSARPNRALRAASFPGPCGRRARSTAPTGSGAAASWNCCAAAAVAFGAPRSSTRWRPPPQSGSALGGCCARCARSGLRGRATGGADLARPESPRVLFPPLARSAMMRESSGRRSVAGRARECQRSRAESNGVTMPEVYADDEVTIELIPALGSVEKQQLHRAARRRRRGGGGRRAGGLRAGARSARSRARPGHSRGRHPLSPRPLGRLRRDAPGDRGARIRGRGGDEPRRGARRATAGGGR